MSGNQDGPGPDVGPHDSSDDAPGPSRAVLARRVLAFEEALDNRLCDSVQRLPFGVARLTPSLRNVYDLTHLQLTGPAAVGEVLAVLDRLFTSFAHRRICTTRAEVAWALGPALVERGWTAGGLRYLVHDRRTPSLVSPVGFAVVDPAGFEPYVRPYVAEQPWGGPAEVVEDMVERVRRLATRIDTRLLVSRDLQAGCHVYRHGAVAQIEEVGVLAAARGQGLGQGLMAAALQQCADADTVFLVADADDWPAGWYRRLGFSPVASGWTWDLRP